MRNSLLAIGLCAALGTVVGCGSGKSDSAESGVALSINNPEAKNPTAERQDQKALVELTNRAKTFAARGMAAQAIEALGHGIGLAPDNADLYRLRGDVYTASGEYASAMADYSAAVRLSPKNAQLYNVRGFFLMSRGEATRALADFSKAIELNDKFAEAYNNRGLIQLAANQIDKAIADFNKAISIKDDYVDAHNNCGFAHYKARRFDQAEQCLNRALQINPDYVNSYNNRGLVRLQTKEFDKSVADFTQAIKRNRFERQYYVSRRTALLQMNEPAAARADAERISWLAGISTMNTRVGQDPGNPSVYVDRGRYFEQAGEQEAAIVDYSRALQLNPAHNEALIARAAALNVIGQYDQAIADCDSALRLAESTRAHSIRGDALMKKGEVDQAIADFERAERFDTVVAQAYLQRAEKLKKSGDTAGAARDRQHALALDPTLK